MVEALVRYVGPRAARLKCYWSATGSRRSGAAACLRHAVRPERVDSIPVSLERAVGPVH